MKTLKEFINEQLGDTSITTVEENQEQVVENTSEKTVAENAEVEKTEVK